MKISKVSKKILAITAAMILASSVFAQETEETENYEEVTTEVAAEEETPSDEVTEVSVESEDTDSYEEPTVTVTASTEADSYEQTEVPATADEYSEVVPIDTKKAAKKKTTIKNPFEGMFTPKQKSYIFYDSTPLSTGTIAYAIKHRTAEVFVDPKTKKVGIQVYYQSSFFDFMFDQKDVALIAEGYEKYLQDFAAHNLIKNNTMKTRKMYTNKGNCRVEWGTIKAMINNFGDTKFHVGYEFKNKAPYFCIIVKDAKNIAPDLGSNVPEKSVEVQLYFTKAEAKQLLDLIGRERVTKELSEDAVVNDEY